MTQTIPPPPAETLSPPRRPAVAAPVAKRHTGGWIAFTVAVIAIVGLGLWWWRSSNAPSAAKEATTKQTRPTPVVVATAHQADLPVYVDGLGTVTALNTVTLRTRVDGQLIKVNYTEGQLVHAGDLLAEVDPQPFQVQLEQAEGQLAKDQALLNNAKLDLSRYQDAREAVSQQQLDTAKSLVAQYAGALQTDQAAIDSAKLQLSYTKITAPLTGKIGLRLVDQGNMVHASDTTGLAVITQIEPIAVVFNLPEEGLQRILKAMKGHSSLDVQAYDRDMKSRIATGKLAAVDNQIDPQTATAKFKAVFDNKDASLYPNQFVNVRLLVETIKDATIVPSAALQRSPNGIYVYVVKSDDTVENRTVTPGQTEGDHVQIVNGLAVGETVVTDGVDKLKPGSSVTPRSTNPGPTTGPTSAGGGEGDGRRGQAQ